MIKKTAVGYQSGAPEFEWVNGASLKIIYPNGNVDFADLKKYNPIPVGPNERSDAVDPCIFNGFLREESDAYITLAGCPFANTFQVTNENVIIVITTRRLKKDTYQ